MTKFIVKLTSLRPKAEVGIAFVTIDEGFLENLISLRHAYSYLNGRKPNTFSVCFCTHNIYTYFYKYFSQKDKRLINKVLPVHGKYDYRSIPIHDFPNLINEKQSVIVPLLTEPQHTDVYITNLNPTRVIFDIISEDPNGNIWSGVFNAVVEDVGFTPSQLEEFIGTSSTQPN